MHAGVPAGEQGQPLLPGPVLAAPYHLRGYKDAAEYAYGRDGNPSWTHLERALGELDGGESTVFASGMAAVTAAIPDAKTVDSPPSSSPSARSRWVQDGFSSRP